MRKYLAIALTICVLFMAVGYAEPDPAAQTEPPAAATQTAPPAQTAQPTQTAASTASAEPDGAETGDAPKQEENTAAPSDAAETAHVTASPAPAQTPVNESAQDGLLGDSNENGGDAPLGEGEEPPEIVMQRPQEDDEAWMEALSGEAGEILSGDLQDILDQIKDLAGPFTIYIYDEEVISAEGYVPDDLEEITLLPDQIRYPEDRYIVKVSETDPNAQQPGEEAPAPDGGEQPQGEELVGEEPAPVLYVWVELKNAPTPTPTPTPTPGPSIEIFVEAPDYQAGTWSNIAPVFTLSGMPEDAQGYNYAAILYDERFVILSGDSYTARDEGEYALRFAILDGYGDVVSLSTRFDLMLDFTPPAYMYVEATSYTSYNIAAEDALSGLKACSVDGGVVWIPLGDGEISAQTGASGAVYAAGTFLAMDNAGNIFVYPEEFSLPVKEPNYYGGGGGGGGDSGDKFVHSPLGGEETLNPYNALDLTISQEPMHTLIIGETELPLTLMLSEAQDFAIESGDLAQFTAELTTWGQAQPAADAAEEAQAQDAENQKAPDTLVLTVDLDERLSGEYQYLWQFNGIVCKMLLNSGIDYLVFREGENIVALATGGFTAGTEYMKLKSAGVSTKKFIYSLWQKGSLLDPLAHEMALEVEVDETDVYPLSADTTAQMYYYNLVSGPAEIMDITFGAYIPEEHA